MAKENEQVICNLDEITFPVWISENPRRTNSEYSKVVTGIIGGMETDLNYCSPRYELVANESIFPEIERVLNDSNIQYSVNYSHIANVRFYADYVITEKQFAHKMAGTNDMIQPLIRVRHSYNGMTKYAITFGYFRLVCDNGLVIPVQEMKDFNLHITGKHTASILGSIEQLKGKLEMFSTNRNGVMTQIINKYEVLASRFVTDTQKRVEEVLEAVGITAVENSKMNTVANILNRVEAEANLAGLGYNGKVNDWLLYNGINAYLNDSSLNIIAPEKRAEKDSSVFEYMLKAA